LGRHLDGTGKYPILAKFDIAPIVSLSGDSCFDSSDNTLWISDRSSGKIWHIDPATGLELPGTINLATAGVPPVARGYGVEYHAPSDTLFVSCLVKKIYQLSKAGVILQTITASFVNSYARGFTLAPTSIQG
jgi:hypothetical protein